MNKILRYILLICLFLLITMHSILAIEFDELYYEMTYEGEEEVALKIYPEEGDNGVVNFTIEYHVLNVPVKGYTVLKDYDLIGAFINKSDDKLTKNGKKLKNILKLILDGKVGYQSYEDCYSMLKEREECLYELSYGYFFYYDELAGRNLEKAKYWFEKAYEKRDLESADAALMLGIMYMNGEGVKQDAYRGAQYLNQAYLDKLKYYDYDENKSFLIKDIVKHISDSCLFLLVDENDNQENKLRFGKISGFVGNLENQSHLGFFYENHNDYEKEAYWYWMAAQNEYPVKNSKEPLEVANISGFKASKLRRFAEYKLGKLLVEGKGVIKNIDKGINYIHSAGEKNLGDAMMTLYEIYRQGLYGQDINIIKSYKWLKELASYNDEIAKLKIEDEISLLKKELNKLKNENDKLDELLNKSEALCYLAPDLPDGYFYKSYYYNVDNYSKALDLLNKTIDKDPDYTQAYRSRGMIHFYKTGKQDKAFEDFNRYLNDYPDDHDIIYFSLVALYDQNKYQQLVNHYYKIKEYLPLTEPDDYGLYVKLAESFFNIGRYEEALPFYSTAHELFPENYDLLNDRAICYLQAGKEYYSDAINDFNKLLKYSPERLSAYINRCFLFIEKGFFDMALIDADTIIEKRPKSYMGYYFKGVAYWKAEEYRESIKCFDKSLERFDQALVSLEPSQKKIFKGKYAFQHAAVFYARGSAYFSLEQYQKALGDLNVALGFKHKKVKQKVKHYIARARVYTLLENYKEALRDFQEAIDLNDGIYPEEFIDALYYYAFTLEKTGNVNEAVTYYNQFIDLSEKENKNISEAKKRLLKMN